MSDRPFFLPQLRRFGQEAILRSTAARDRLSYWRREGKAAALVVVVFLACVFLPVGRVPLDGAVAEAFHLVQAYAREHVVLCLVPAFFIAGAISVFVRQASVLRYLGARANRVTAYGVASVSGGVLAVCSCTILPLFAGIYRRGAGLGPATAFLYAGPAINVLAIVLTARLLGADLGFARAVGAVGFSIVIGLLMHVLFRGEELERTERAGADVSADEARPVGQTALFVATMVGILVAANWGRSADPSGWWAALYGAKWLATAGFGVLLGALLGAWFGVRWWEIVAVAVPVIALARALPAEPVVPFAAGIVGIVILAGGRSGELGEWFDASWQLARQILPLLLVGVLASGLLLGRPGEEGLIPSAWVTRAVGGDSLAANVFASVAGGLMYFATLTEVPIVQGLLGAGMGKGPALALLLAGPAISLPNMLVIRTVLGTRRTVTYVTLVVVMASLSGFVFGRMVP